VAGLRLSSPFNSMARLRLWPFGLPILVAIVIGCESAEPEAAPLPQPVNEWQRDSSAYDEAVAIWLRDSAVVDSVARTINTDSLFRMYRRMLNDTNPAAKMQEIACEEWRLRRRYQTLPSTAAQRRMMDTLWWPPEADAVRRMNERLANIGPITTGPYACGGDVERLVSEVVSGAPMSMSTARPVPPRQQPR
jgi:hypothetical protein